MRVLYHKGQQVFINETDLRLAIKRFAEPFREIDKDFYWLNKSCHFCDKYEDCVKCPLGLNYKFGKCKQIAVKLVSTIRQRDTRFLILGGWFKEDNEYMRFVANEFINALGSLPKVKKGKK